MSNPRPVPNHALQRTGRAVVLVRTFVLVFALSVAELEFVRPRSAMYRYMPPKSSVWGHALRKGSPLQQQRAFDEFLQQTAAEHSFTSGHLTILPRSRQTEHSQAELATCFARVLGVPPQSGDFPRLNFTQFSECLYVFATEPVCVADRTCHVMLNGSFVVTKWRVADRIVATRSRFTLDFGTSPRMTTFLDFESVEQFRTVQHALSDFRLCRLNEKHLKEIRRTKTARHRPKA